MDSRLYKWAREGFNPNLDIKLQKPPFPVMVVRGPGPDDITLYDPQVGDKVILKKENGGLPIVPIIGEKKDDVKGKR